MDIYQAWSTGRPIFQRLPECYRDNNIADYLTQFWDSLLLQEKARVDDLERQLNPLTCDSNWLDFLAPLCGFTGKFWDKNWNDYAKRNLLASAYTLIWCNKGSKDTLSLVLSCFQIPNVISSKGDFILGSSQVGIEPLGSAAWEYTIYLQSNSNNPQTVSLVKKLNKLFGPCWCKSHIEFNDSLISEYLVLDDQQLIFYTVL